MAAVGALPHFEDRGHSLYPNRDVYRPLGNAG